MPSKKKLQKQIREHQQRADMYETLFTRCIRAWERQEELFEKAIDAAEADVRALLKDIGEPDFYDGTHEAGRVRVLRERYGVSDPAPEEVASKLTEAVAQPRAYTRRDMFDGGGQTVTAKADGRDGIIHNHDLDPSCRERRVFGGTLRGECMGDAA